MSLAVSSVAVSYGIKSAHPFSELVDALAARAYIGPLSDAFRTYVNRTLRNGKVLLLYVNGLEQNSPIPVPVLPFVSHCRFPSSAVSYLQH